MEEKCLENFNLIAQQNGKHAEIQKALETDSRNKKKDIDKDQTSGRERQERALNDILLNLPSTSSHSSMSLLQEDDFGNLQHDFAEVLDEDTTTSGVLETFEISSSNSLPTCSDMAADVAVVDDSSSADGIKMVGITEPSVVSSCNNKFFNDSEIYVINDDDDDEEDDDDDAVIVTNDMENESRSDSIVNVSQMTNPSADRTSENQLNGVIMTTSGATIYLETPVVEEQQHHHSNNIINIVVSANGSRQTADYGNEKLGIPKRLSDEFILTEDADQHRSQQILINVDDNGEDIGEDRETKEKVEQEGNEKPRKASLTDKSHKSTTNTSMTAPVSDAGAGVSDVIATNESIAGRKKCEPSSAEGNAERMSFRLKNMSINNSTTNDAANTITSAIRKGAGGALDDIPSGSNGVIAAPTMADIESMDLIERRDFETEQRLTGGITLKSSSLIDKNLLNLRVVKQVQQSQCQNILQSSQHKQMYQMQEDNSQHHTMGRIYSSDTKCTYKEPLTTPTSSRTYNSRLTKSTAKLNMNSTLSQQDGVDRKQRNPLPTAGAAPKCTSTSLASLASISSASTSALSSSSSVIVEAPATSREFCLTGTCSQIGNEVSLDASSKDRTVNNCQREREIAESGCSRTSALYNSGASASINANRRGDDSEPSTSARCQYTPQVKASVSGVRQVHHASAQTNDRYLSRNASTRASSPAVSSSAVGFTSPNLNLSAAANFRNRRRIGMETTAHLPRNSTSEDAAFKVVAEEFNEDDAWADCEEHTSSDLEEICTCHNRSDSESSHSSNTTLNEEDFDSTANTSVLYRDGLDLPGYLHTSEDAVFGDATLNDHGGNATTSFAMSSVNAQHSQRKRKYNDGRLLENDYNGPGMGNCADANGDGSGNIGFNLAVSDANSRKRIAYDFTSTPRSPFSSGNVILNATPTTSQIAVSSFGSPLGRRTPRSLIPTRDNPPPELQNWLTQFQRWTHAERLLAVDRLIEHCEPTQVRHMMKVIEPQFQRDFISLLPRELALQVLAYLDPKDLLRAAQTCRSWRFLCDDNLLWKEKCRKAQILTEALCDRPKRGRAGNMPPIASPWKAAYMRQHIIEMNWRSRPIRDPKVLKGHDEHVITCLQFSGNRIVSGSDDNTLKVWSAVTGRCLRTLIGHTGGVWSSQMSGNIIISGSTDRTLKVWDMETGMCVHTLLGHTSTVRCMHLHGNKVVSGSRDATLRVWDIEQGTCLHVLVGHLAAVRCVQYDGKLIVSGAYDYMVRIWHPERQECLHTLQGHTNRVYSLQFDGVHVVSGSLDTSIRVWDVETGNCKHTLMGHQSLTSGMELRQNILVSGNADSTVKVWDITSGQCLQTLSGPNKHQSAVTCLQFNSRFVVTSSDDGTVKLWDVKTGEFIRNLVSLDSGGSGGVVWRIRANDTKLICAVGSRNGTEETKLLVLDFDVEGACVKCS